MREHALPQDVTSYKFHIIGNMTLRQFGEVAGGCAIGFLIYLTNLPTIIKWPLILIFAGVGAIAAFLPIAERPLDQWVIAFFKALYRPTLFFWKRTSKIPDPFLHKANQDVPTLVADVDLTPVRRQRVKEFMHSVQTAPEKDTLEKYTDQRLQEVMSIFGPDSAAGTTITPDGAAPAFSYAAPAVPPAEVLGTDQASLETPDVDGFSQMPADQTTFDSSTADFAPILQAAAGMNDASTPETPAKTVEVPQMAPVGNAQAAASTMTPSDTFMPAPITVFDSDETHNAPAENWQPTNQAASQFSSTESSLPEAHVAVPQTTAVTIDPVAKSTEAYTDTPTAAPSESDAAYTNVQAAPTVSAPMSAAQSNTSLPFPSPPTEPNKVVGMVLDQANNPLPNVIVEIRTPEGLPARAVKTNAIGQFFITTPLANGNYVVVAERDGMEFAPLSLPLSGAVVAPLEVRAN